jgi:undecaprenyl-diphosphatase
MRALLRIGVLRSRDWIVKLDLFVLLAGLVFFSSVWGFLAIADMVENDKTRHFDEWCIQSLRQPEDPGTPIGPAWLGEMARDLTALGGHTLLILLVVAIAGHLLLMRRYCTLALLVGTMLGGLVLNPFLKNLYKRPRPALVPHLSYVEMSSFPSGHSMLSAVAYLTLAALLAQLVRRRGHKVYFILLASLFTVLVGFSRVYLGVHWPTDVLAGWLVGLAWAVLCWLVARQLQRYGLIEISA